MVPHVLIPLISLEYAQSWYWLLYRGFGDCSTCVWVRDSMDLCALRLASLCFNGPLKLKQKKSLCYNRVLFVDGRTVCLWVVQLLTLYVCYGLLNNVSLWPFIAVQ